MNKKQVNRKNHNPFELTPTQKEYLDLANTGLSNVDIALKLGVKLTSVKTMLSVAREKERVKNEFNATFKKS